MTDEVWKPTNEVEARAFLHGALGVLNDMMALSQDVVESVQRLVGAIRETIEQAPLMAEHFIAQLKEGEQDDES